MGLKKLPYKTIDSLLKANFDTRETKDTLEARRHLRQARQRGWLSKSELCIVCKWKSPRAIHHIRSNSHSAIKTITKKAFETKNEIERLNLLIRLNGVSVPMASALLALLYPEKYGVIDIRVWQVLYKLRVVGTKQRGTGLNADNWDYFLMLIRYYAAKYKVTARAVELTFFRVHEKYQDGRLYNVK